MGANRIALSIPDEKAMLRFGALFAAACTTESAIEHTGQNIYLHGELGTGKTTLVRGFLRGMGHTGAVKSPTYTLVEHYCYKNQTIYHFDLYRLGEPEELEYMGIRDYFHQQASCLIEWPERGEGVLPNADIDITLSYHGEAQRRLLFEPNTRQGVALFSRLKDDFGSFSA